MNIFNNIVYRIPFIRQEIPLFLKRRRKRILHFRVSSIFACKTVT